LEKQPLKKYFEYFARKRGLLVVTILLLVLLAGAFFLSRFSAREMKRVINEDFNYQQLGLAKHAADILTQNFTILKRELMNLSLSPSIQYAEAVAWANRMKISLSSIGEYGVFQIMLISADGANSYSINHLDAFFVEKGSYGQEDYFQWCKKPENKGKIYISGARKGVVQNSEPGFVMVMCMPVYQISSDEAHPKPTQRFTGVLVFVLDAGLLAEKFVGPIRSGKTGYAWVIDESGNFLYHVEKDFIGENAFEVRKFKDSHISFSQINQIQKTKMLDGQEGASWYVSGWHRGVIGTMKKLIAYAPVHIGAANTSRVWSVAVVAPISEVGDAVHAAYVRQALIQGAFTAAVIAILVFLIANERAWLKTLEREVKEKTQDLESYARRLRRSQERYRSLVESADDMIYTIDKNCNILSINRYWTLLTGQQAEEAIGKNVMDIMEYKAPDNVCSIVGKAFETSETFAHEERVKMGDREYWLDTKYKPVLTAEGRTNAVLVISRDVTEQKMMEEQLFHTEKLASLGSLSAGVAHEMNNPIAIILGFTELLLEKSPKDSKEYEILKTIERQGNNCKRIVENLLAFARIPQKATMKTDVVEDLQSVVGVVTNTLLTTKVDLKTDIDESLPKVRGDSQHLEQVFLNIVNNAVSAMDGGGILTISAHRSIDMVEISFSDTGRGISPEDMDKIFEPFFTTKRVGEGTGLGLSVSYALVKKVGGDIRVKSQTREEGEEPGTTVTVLLNMADEEISPSENGSHETISE
jgi:PAS domain S-box-containing protein